ncbi:MAG TPA: EAL domain-containing protein [Thiobacillus sp.]|nr:EAL domain-containing protein [Thiobacillus sp.]
MKVLCVEDNVADADLVQCCLARENGYAIDIAPTLAQACERLKAPHDFDLVLSDLRLPDGSGLDLLAWIRERNQPLAVVILTGSGDQEAAVTALKIGADDYIVKRGDYVQRLPNILQAALARHRDEAARKARLLKVLYVEHNVFDVDLTRRHLAQYAPNIQLEVVGDASQALERLLASAPAIACDVLLLDYQLPGLNALDLIKVLRHEHGIDLPMVLVTGQGNEELAVQVLRLGFSDYLVKQPGYLHQLPFALESAYHRAVLTREQAALKRSQDRYEELVTRIPVGIYRFRMRETGGMAFDYASPRFCEMLDLSQAVLLADVDRAFAQVHPDEMAEFMRLHEAARRALEPLAWEGRFVVNGRVHWLHIESIPTQLNNGDVILDGVVMDVTARRKAEDQLRLSATVFESTQDGVVIANTEPRILAVNHAYQEITGYTEQEALDKNPSFLQSGRHDRSFYQSMWSSIQQTGHWQGEIWNRRKNGEVYPQLTTLSAVHNDQGEVTNYVGVFTDISQLKQTEARLERLAHYDPLTALPNRLLFQSRMEHALEGAHRQGAQVALLLIDLDRFKDVNDSLGHPAGDELLQKVTERVRQRLREEDTLARLGGDEFVVLLERLAHPQDAGRVAQEIIDALLQLFRLDSGAEVGISASIGISLYPEHGTTPSELTQHADAALYLAKGQGRHTYRYYTEALTRASQDRLSLEARLRRALERDEFQVYYQPQVEIASGRIVGAEALVRWLDPVAGMIMPDRFICIAEESGLIIPLGEQVLRTACWQAKAWSDAGLPAIHLAVNLSPRQFAHPDLAGQILGVLHETGFDPKRLELELTESALMSEGGDAAALLNQLKTLGVRLAIDDFGTGYSSLSYLRHFPLDTLKIDKSFVRDIPRHRDDMEIATAIIQLAHVLGFTVLAEGVETDEQLSFLRDRGCDLYQGYLFSKPVPAAEFMRLLG